MVPIIKRYCVGFAYYLDHVVLIKKKRPDFQAGLFNGIGGSLEFGESHLQAMVREFREETGTWVREGQWRYMGMLNDPYLENAEVSIFVGELGAFQYLNIINQVPHQRVMESVDKDYEVIEIVNYVHDALKLHNDKKFIYNILDLLIETSQVYKSMTTFIVPDIQYQGHDFKSWITKP